MIQLESLFDLLQSADIPEFAIRTILDKIVDQPSFRINIDGQEGYITYRNTFYLFQPLRFEDRGIPLAYRVANTIVRRDQYSPSKIEIKKAIKLSATVKPEEAKEEEEEEITKVLDSKDVIKFWNECINWGNQMKNGTSPIDIPPDLLNVLYIRYKNNDLYYNRIYYYFTMFSWMVESIGSLNENERAKYYKALGEVFLDYVWDEIMRVEEQKMILKEPRTDDIKRVSVEQCILRNDSEIFRYVNVETGEIIYDCSKIIKDAIEKSDPLNKLIINMNTTGIVYGFLIPKLNSKIIVFKTNNPPKGPLGKLGIGKDCDIVSSISKHKEELREIRSMFLELNYPVFLLSDSVLNEKATRNSSQSTKVEPGNFIYKQSLSSSLAKGIDNSEAIKIAEKAKKEALEKSPDRLKIESVLFSSRREFQNHIKACALKNIILRFLDNLESKKEGGKKYFYRPIAAIKKHRLN